VVAASGPWRAARIAREVDPNTRTMAVELNYDNTGAKPLVPGAYAEVLWSVQREVPSLFVPPSAIATTSERTFVDRVRDGEIEQATVGRGVLTADLVEVFGDLAAGDQVMKRGSDSDGARECGRSAAICCRQRDVVSAQVRPT
jgi:multidrug efflux pump subunit AcrA (membrane-fusion protein)